MTPKKEVFLLRPLTSARIPGHFEPVRQVQGDEGNMPEALQEHDGGKDCKLYLNGRDTFTYHIVAIGHDFLSRALRSLRPACLCWHRTNGIS